MAVEFDNGGHVVIRFVGETRLCLMYGQPSEMKTDQIELMVRLGHPVAEVLPQHREEMKKKLEAREAERILELGRKRRVN